MPGEVNNFIDNTFEQCLYILDSRFEIKLIIDIFSDLIWTERYYAYGEFEVTMPANQTIIDQCHRDDYMALSWTNTIMIIESILSNTDSINGDTITISGRSLTSILDRRIIVDEVVGTLASDGTPNNVGLVSAIKTILTNNFISPTDPNRQIPNFSFKEITDPAIKNLVIGSFQELGTPCYDEISSICEDMELGFKVNAIDGGGFEFELYFGVDRSWDQEEVFPVVFSDSYENLITSNYLESSKNYKSVAYVNWKWRYEELIVVPDGTGSNTVMTVNGSGDETTELSRETDTTGLLRREIYLSDGGGTYDIKKRANLASYRNQIKNKTDMYLSAYNIEKMFEGDVEYARQFVYGKDYFLGDIVQLENKNSQTGKCRVTEIVFTWNSSGQSLIPTFKKLE